MSNDAQESLNDSFLKTLKSSELAGLPVELADALIGLPVFSTLTKIGASYGGFANYLFAKRVLKFLKSVESLPKDERSARIDQRFTSEKDRRHFSERVLESLRRIDDERKAIILGNATVGLLKDEITTKEFWRIVRSIDILSLDEELPILYILEDYKREFYVDGQQRDDAWNYEGVFLAKVKERYSEEMTDSQLRSIMWGITSTGLFGPAGWRNGPAHDCEFAPLYFKLKSYLVQPESND